MAGACCGRLAFFLVRFGFWGKFGLWWGVFWLKEMAVFFVVRIGGFSDKIWAFFGRELF